jgi:hypothetical protein
MDNLDGREIIKAGIVFGAEDRQVKGWIVG